MNLESTVPALDSLVSQQDRWKARLQVLYRRLGDEGRISNPEQFGPIAGTDFFEFKAFQVRMPCYFRPDKRVVIAHGFLKKSDKIRRGDLERAENTKQSYEEILKNIVSKVI